MRVKQQNNRLTRWIFFLFFSFSIVLDMHTHNFVWCHTITELYTVTESVTSLVALLSRKNCRKSQKKTIFSFVSTIMLRMDPETHCDNHFEWILFWSRFSVDWWKCIYIQIDSFFPAAADVVVVIMRWEIVHICQCQHYVNTKIHKYHISTMLLPFTCLIKKWFIFSQLDEKFLFSLFCLPSRSP